VSVQLAVLGAVHVVACGLVYFGVAVGAGRVLRSRPRAACVIGRGSGVAMIVIAVALVIERAVAG
jgi:threonine/homoserine/homoserine lactone efflux protein